jgi:hypothetical protein
MQSRPCLEHRGDIPNQAEWFLFLFLLRDWTNWTGGVAAHCVHVPMHVQMHVQKQNRIVQKQIGWRGVPSSFSNFRVKIKLE